MLTFPTVCMRDRLQAQRGWVTRPGWQSQVQTQVSSLWDPSTILPTSIRWQSA